MQSILHILLLWSKWISEIHFQCSSIFPMVKIRFVKWKNTITTFVCIAMISYRMRLCLHINYINYKFKCKQNDFPLSFNSYFNKYILTCHIQYTLDDIIYKLDFFSALLLYPIRKEHTNHILNAFSKWYYQTHFDGGVLNDEIMDR